MKQNTSSLLLHLSLLCIGLASCGGAQDSKDKHLSEIGPYQANPLYWQLDGEPVLLMGGAVSDNMFQFHPVEPELDRLLAAGGNFIRCSLSSRHQGNQWPYQQNLDARYDLEKWSEGYWQRLDKFLAITQEKKIVVQLELWNINDFILKNNWAKNPFNPAVNPNYSQEETDLPTQLEMDADVEIMKFFQKDRLDGEVLTDNPLLKYQQAFMDKVLETTLGYGHVLYKVSSSPFAGFEWENYWYGYLQERAAEEGKKIYVAAASAFKDEGAILTASAKATGLAPGAQNFNFDQNTLGLDFLETSKVNLKTGEDHYNAALSFYRILSTRKPSKPFHNTMIWGGEQDTEVFGGMEEGAARFWRNIFAKSAAVHFEVPPTGIGLDRLAEVNLKSARMLTDSVQFFQMTPANDLLLNREENEAFCLAYPGIDYALHFPGCAEVVLDLQGYKGELKIQWLELLLSRWEESITEHAEGVLQLKSPCEGTWAVWVSLH